MSLCLGLAFSPSLSVTCQPQLSAGTQLSFTTSRFLILPDSHLVFQLWPWPWYFLCGRRNELLDLLNIKFRAITPVHRTLQLIPSLLKEWRTFHGWPEGSGHTPLPSVLYLFHLLSFHCPWISPELSSLSFLKMLNNSLIKATPSPFLLPGVLCPPSLQVWI